MLGERGLNRKSAIRGAVWVSGFESVKKLGFEQKMFLISQ